MYAIVVQRRKASQSQNIIRKKTLMKKKAILY